MSDDSLPAVRELRLVVTAADYDAALHFYRDVLGLPERAAFSSDGGRVSILEAGRATLEITDPNHAAFIDDVEVGRRVASTTSGSRSRWTTRPRPRRSWRRLLRRGGRRTDPHPLELLNARLEAPGALQLTLFTELGDGGDAGDGS